MNDTYGVAGNEELVALLIVEYEGKDAAEIFQKVDALVAIEGEDDLAVATRLEVILAGILLADVLMVIYLAIHGQHLLMVRRIQRLTARLRVDNAQSLVSQDGRAAAIDATPVRSAVTDLLTHA